MATTIELLAAIRARELRRKQRQTPTNSRVQKIFKRVNSLTISSVFSQTLGKINDFARDMVTINLASERRRSTISPLIVTITVASTQERHR